VPGPLRAHDRREAAVLMRLANSLPAGIADMAPVRSPLPRDIFIILACCVLRLHPSHVVQDMAAKVAESLGLLPFDLQAELGYMQHRSSL
jgi:hypothetical protein